MGRVRRTAPAMGAAAAALVLAAGVGGCAGGGSAGRAARAAVTTQPTPQETPAVVARVHHKRRTPVATSTPSPHAASTSFHWSTSRVTAADLGKSWHPGCPLPPSSLRALSLTFWGFDGRAHQGTLIANVSVVRSYVSAFGALYRDRFPIRRMVPVSAYGGSDNKSMAADNTSSFNCRYAVSNGPKSWSMHAYGEAVDIDPIENPYRLDGKVLPPAGRPYLDRSRVRPGMVVPGSAPVRVFASIGWGWGGNWSSSPDYQHFSTNGK